MTSNRRNDLQATLHSVAESAARLPASVLQLNTCFSIHTASLPLSPALSHKGRGSTELASRTTQNRGSISHSTALVLPGRTTVHDSLLLPADEVMR